MKLDWFDELKAQEIELETDTPLVKRIEVKTTNKVIVKQSLPKTTGRLSKTPWVEITGEAIDPEKGICLSLDWNDEFISYLKQNGIAGADEEQVVQRYITMLYRELIEQMGQEPSEFE